MADKVAESVPAPEVVEQSPVKKVPVAEPEKEEEKDEVIIEKDTTEKTEKPLENGTSEHKEETNGHSKDTNGHSKEVTEEKVEKTNGTTEAEKRPAEDSEAPVKKVKVTDTPEEESKEEAAA